MSQSSRNSERLSRRFGRVVLSLAALLLTLIGGKYIVDPIGAGAAAGISLPSSLGLTNMRAGVGGFALGLGIVTALSAWSPSRIASGLWTLLGVVGTVLVVRLAASLMDGTVPASTRILIPEALIVAASAGALTSIRMTRARGRPLP
jgi:hypothetical protein